MDYEQKYKDALERAKAMIKVAANQDEAISFANTIFPELLDEDERIRKTLIEYFNAYPKDYFGGLKKSYLLAWLEKQGESYTKRDIDDAYLKGVTTTKNEIEKQYEANYQIRKDIATFIFNYKGDIKDRAKWIDYLGIKVSFAGMQGEQNLIMAKSPQLGEQKPAWSEEDEDILNTIINHFEIDLECTKNDDIIRWLKSLKPQNKWKPNDEQIHAFEQVYDWYNNNFAPSETLTSFYNDLKKLKE